jgi:hypothetical protein
LPAIRFRHRTLVVRRRCETPPVQRFGNRPLLIRAPHHQRTSKGRQSHRGMTRRSDMHQVPTRARHARVPMRPAGRAVNLPLAETNPA